MTDSNNPYLELGRALARRQSVIADHQWRDTDADGHLAAIRSVAAEIDRLGSRLPLDCPARLKHYIERQSYDKALDFIAQAHPQEDFS